MTEYRPSTRVAAVLESRSRAGDWLRRYGVAELAGISTALVSAWVADVLGAHPFAVAFAATVGENFGFYATIIGRQVAADRRVAQRAGEPYVGRRVWRTTRELLLEFGPAELLDSLIIRPAAMGLGIRFLGRDAGVVAGKLAADVTFYLPVILTYELRRAGKRSDP